MSLTGRRDTTSSILDDIKTNTNIQFGYNIDIRTGGDPTVENRAVYYRGKVDNGIAKERTIGIPFDCPVLRVSRPTTASVVSITSSDNVADVLAGDGTGAQKVLCIGLDINYEPITEVIDLTGQTPSVGSVEFLRCERMVLTQVGTGESNVGDIYSSFSGESYTTGIPDNNIRCAILAGASLSSFGMRTVPAGRRSYYTAFDFYTTAIATRPFTLIQNQYSFVPGGNAVHIRIETSLSAGIHFQSPSPPGIAEKVDFEFSGYAQTGTDLITAFAHTILADM